MMKSNKINFLWLLLFAFPPFVVAGGHKEHFLSDILKLDISELDDTSSSSLPPAYKKQEGRVHQSTKKTASTAGKK
ncbi:hypothetical protein JS781_004516, partial [Salmonella enterica subsp. enterica serovar Reading]|nr:hypothetical protein [Salmonella enterica subsp. enterica serovar Reading]EHC4763396.1 hypothetical protein [Salmonella enterica subsp. enterica serovar Reading]EHX6386486.1 hypothetical protein [Salmonella enterica subsp. enterica serovar Reading]